MATDSQDEVLNPKAPEWVPPVVDSAAKLIYQRELSAGTSDSDNLRLLNRLTSDDRMKEVWRVLNGTRYRKNNSAKTFVHPHQFFANRQAQLKRRIAAVFREEGDSRSHHFKTAKERKIYIEDHKPYNEATARLIETEADFLVKEPIQGPSSLSEQDCAMYCFFFGAYYIGRDPLPLLTRNELDKYVEKYGKTARKLEELSKTVRSFGIEGHAEELLQQASDLEGDASFVEVDYEDRGIKIVERPRGDRHLQSYVVQLARISRAIFGDPLYGTLATTANVALERERKETVEEKDQDRQIVREILRMHPETGLGFVEIPLL